MDDPRSNEEPRLEKIERVFRSLDEARVAGLHRLRETREVQTRAQERERVRLTAKYGAHHPRVVKATKQIVYNQGVRRGLDIQIERAEIKVPEVEQDTWTVYGRIVDSEWNVQSGLTVSLVDAAGERPPDIEYACTDESGYYEVRIERIAAATEGEALRDLFLIVSDRERLLHRDRQALTPSAGRIALREILLGEPPELCEPPLEAWSEAAPPDGWIVRGGVVDEGGTGIGGLIISLYDKDLIFDDALGTTVTNQDGSFRILYRTDAFRDLFEKRPDLYLKVLDRNGRVLYTSENAVRTRPRSIEHFSIELP